MSININPNAFVKPRTEKEIETERLQTLDDLLSLTTHDLMLKGIVERNDIPEDMIEKYIDKLANVINTVIQYQKLSDNFLRKHMNIMDIDFVIIYQIVTEQFLVDYQDYIDMNYVSRYQILSDQFILDFGNVLNWDLVLKYQKVSAATLTYHVNHLRWDLVAKYQQLSQKFIDDFIKRLRPALLARYQTLTPSFIDKYYRKLGLSNVVHYQKLQTKFIQEHINEIMQIILENISFTEDEPDNVVEPDEPNEPLVDDIEETPNNTGKKEDAEFKAMEKAMLIRLDKKGTNLH